jgi:hypothetical protein
MVNAEIGKKILSYDIVLKKYEDVYKKKILLDDYEITKKSSNNIDYNKIVYGIFIIFLILLIINFINILMKK